MSNNVYDVVTAKIVERLEKGVVPWRQPWTTVTPRNFVTGRPYRGINFLLLSSVENFKSPLWLTYKQCKSVGGSVIRGSKGMPVVFTNFLDVADKDSDETKIVPIRKRYSVFNVEQCLGLKLPEKDTPIASDETLPKCEELWKNMPNPPELTHGQGGAFYRVSTDTIHMPEKCRFDSVEEYWSTCFHEIGHSTGNRTRLNRPTLTGFSGFASENYSLEELVAEVSASFMCALTGIGNRTIDASSSYLAGWLNALKSDSRLIVQAAGQAQKAVDYVTGELPTKQ